MNVQGWAKEWALGCVNTPPAAKQRESQEAGFTQPRVHSLAHPCTQKWARAPAPTDYTDRAHRVGGGVGVVHKRLLGLRERAVLYFSTPAALGRRHRRSIHTNSCPNVLLGEIVHRELHFERHHLPLHRPLRRRHPQPCHHCRREFLARGHLQLRGSELRFLESFWLGLVWSAWTIALCQVFYGL